MIQTIKEILKTFWKEIVGMAVITAVLSYFTSTNYVTDGVLYTIIAVLIPLMELVYIARVHEVRTNEKVYKNIPIALLKLVGLGLIVGIATTVVLSMFAGFIIVMLMMNPVTTVFGILAVYFTIAAICMFIGYRLTMLAPLYVIDKTRMFGALSESNAIMKERTGYLPYFVTSMLISFILGFNLNTLFLIQSNTFVTPAMKVMYLSRPEVMLPILFWTVVTFTVSRIAQTVAIDIYLKFRQRQQAELG